MYSSSKNIQSPVAQHAFFTKRIELSNENNIQKTSPATIAVKIPFDITNLTEKGWEQTDVPKYLIKTSIISKKSFQQTSPQQKPT